MEENEALLSIDAANDSSKRQWPTAESRSVKERAEEERPAEVAAESADLSSGKVARPTRPAASVPRLLEANENEASDEIFLDSQPAVQFTAPEAAPGHNR